MSLRTGSPCTPWIVYLANLVSLGVLAVVIAVANPQPEGACSGIGWGCSLYGWDAAGFALLVLGVPYALVLLAAVALPALLGAGRVATALAALGLLVPWTVVMWFELSAP